VGAEVRANALPLFPGASLDQALHGGEDYELLFTLPRGRRPPSGVSEIGTITPGKHLMLVDPDYRRRRLPLRGFQHNL